MARESSDEQYIRPIRRLIVAITVLLLIVLTLVWRIDNPRVERIRAAVVDRVVPNMEWAMAPLNGVARMVDGFQSYARLFEQNQELREELQRMRAFQEAAQQLEEENARLLALNRVQLNPELTFVTGIVQADAGSPFRRSVIINVGARDGLLEGWATMDGLGVVGRITGVGERSSRVLLLTDSNSRLPVTILPSGQQALLLGDNSRAPVLDFIESPTDLAPGDQVVTSGDGGVFPPGLLVGRVAEFPDGRLRVQLAADLPGLRFLRVLRSHPGTTLEASGALIGPPWPPPPGFVEGQTVSAAPSGPVDTEGRPAPRDADE